MAVAESNRMDRDEAGNGSQSDDTVSDDGVSPHSNSQTFDISSYAVVTNISIIIALLAVLLTVLYFWLRRRHAPVIRNVESIPQKLRFRKREKIMFYGRKMLRHVRSFARGGNTPLSSAPTSRRSTGGRKRKLVQFAKRFLRFRREQEPQTKQLPRELPSSLLEVDMRPGMLEPAADYHRLPPELMYMLRNVRVLGHFEQPIFLELCRFMESRFVPAGNYLFNVGDPDDSIYVVQSGCVEVRIADNQAGNDYFAKVRD